MSTPIRLQYLELKQRYPDTILFFRLGDFYETFDDDAKLVAAELQITLTSKANIHPRTRDKVLAKYGPAVATAV